MLPLRKCELVPLFLTTRPMKINFSPAQLDIHGFCQVWQQLASIQFQQILCMFFSAFDELLVKLQAPCACCILLEDRKKDDQKNLSINKRNNLLYKKGNARIPLESSKKSKFFLLHWSSCKKEPNKERIMTNFVTIFFF